MHGYSLDSLGPLASDDHGRGAGPQEDQVAADPLECRKYATACLRLAQAAKTSELSAALLSMAQAWTKLAADAEHYETLLLAQCEKEPSVGSTPQDLEAWLEAGL